MRTILTGDPSTVLLMPIRFEVGERLTYKKVIFYIFVFIHRRSKREKILSGAREIIYTQEHAKRK